MLKKYLAIVVSTILAYVITSCEPEEDFGFPSKIDVSAKGETIDLVSKDISPHITHIEVLDYDGNGNNSGLLTENQDYIEATTDWLTVKYYHSEYKLILIAGPNVTNKNRKLYLYLLSGNSRQEITVRQSK